MLLVMSFAAKKRMRSSRVHPHDVTTRRVDRPDCTLRHRVEEPDGWVGSYHDENGDVGSRTLNLISDKHPLPLFIVRRGHDEQIRLIRQL